MCFMLVLGEISSAQHKFCDCYATTRFAGANTCANSLCQLVVRLRLSSAATKLLVRAGSCHSDCCNEPLTASVWSSRRATATLLTASEISFCCSPKSTSGVRTDDQSAATVPSVAQQLHGSNKVTASHDRIFDGNVRLEELGRPIEQRLTVACQLLNVLSGELEADVAAATSSAVDSSHGNHLLGRDSRYDKGKPPKSSSIMARENTLLKYILPSRYTYGICYTDILHKISVVGHNQDASIIVF